MSEEKDPQTYAHDTVKHRKWLTSRPECLHDELAEMGYYDDETPIHGESFEGHSVKGHYTTINPEDA